MRKYYLDWNYFNGYFSKNYNLHYFVVGNGDTVKKYRYGTLKY